MQSANVAKLIEERLHARNSAKKARGEVFTPLELVQEMLLGVRRGLLERDGRVEIWGIDASGNYFDDDERDRMGGIPLTVWRDPGSKWLDPAGGIGNFLVVAYGYLDYQLGAHGPARLRDAGVRGRHIVEHMLYMFEIDGENVATARSIFEGVAADGAPNIFKKDTLGLDVAAIRKLCGVAKFDVIMGNPPFNSGGVKSSGTGAGYETLWPHFLLRDGGGERSGTGSERSGTGGQRTFPGALSLLVDGGALCMIHPSSWMHLGNGEWLNKELLGREVGIMRAYTNLQSNRLFNYGGAVPCAYYTVFNRSMGTGSRRKFPYIDVEERLEMIPNKGGTVIFQRYNSLMQAVRAVPTVGETGWLTGKGKLSVASAGKTDVGKYEYICQHLAVGVNVCKSSVEPAHFGIPKILFKGTSKLYHFDDWEGRYGLYGHWGYTLVDPEGSLEGLRRMSAFLDTRFARAIMMATKEDQDFIEPRWLPDVRRLPTSVKMTDAGLCAHFGIPKESLATVEKYSNSKKIANRSVKCGRETCSGRFSGGNSSSGGKRKTQRIRRLI
jgi:hypothetical protein